MHLDKHDNCPECGAELDQHGYDMQHCPCGWGPMGKPSKNALRKQFEQWCGGRYNLKTKKNSMGDTIYVDHWVQGAWVGFQAGRRTRN